VVDPASSAALKSGNRRALAKCITLVESKRPEDRLRANALIEEILPDTGSGFRIGISGVPGVGKSTFIEAFGLLLISMGKKVAVLAVDPSSPVGGGSILGDKTRMSELSRSPDAFIRPSPSSGIMGGTAQRTRETILLCEAAGYDVLIVETVGVGQSEVEVHGMVDFFMMLMVPNAGDELQGIKRGITELVDAVVINKADGSNLLPAQQAKSWYQSALDLLRGHDAWKPRVMTCSAQERTNLEEIWQMIEAYFAFLKDDNRLTEKRQQQNLLWLRWLVSLEIDQYLKSGDRLKDNVPILEQQVSAGEITPFRAAREIIDLLFVDSGG
jgi:LAO/AO transport system kinase